MHYLLYLCIDHLITMISNLINGGKSYLKKDMTINPNKSKVMVVRRDEMKCEYDRKM